MKILVAIANHGTSNERYVRTLIDCYKGFDHDVTIVILSNIEKDLGSDVELRVGVPSSNPWSLPFAHKDLFAERQDDYDLFIYSEDDTLITQDAVDAFVAAEAVLPSDRIAGFVRHEIEPNGTYHYSTVHGAYHWDPASVITAGGEVYANFTNEHSAAFILSRKKLKACIASGNFLCPPHHGRYDMLCSAATDPYTRCGLTKVVCVSRLLDFSLHHLPNKYIGKIGVPKAEMDLQIEKLLQIARGETSCASLLDWRTKVEFSGRYDRSYYTPGLSSVAKATQGPPLRVLSVGCDDGRMEHELIKSNHEVEAIPLDYVIAASAEMRGVKVLNVDLSDPAPDIADGSYDVIMMNLCLPYMREPATFLKAMAGKLKANGRFLIVCWNWQALPEQRRRRREQEEWPEARIVGDFGQSGIHATDMQVARGWLRDVGFPVEKTVVDVAPKYQRLSTFGCGVLDRWIGVTASVLSGPRR
ncbi:MAG: class I SAM-dependent methyltransferase [Paracoccaceae bacterium]